MCFSVYRLDIVDGVRIFLGDLKLLITTIIKYIVAGFKFLVFLISSFWKLFFVFFVLWLFWYLAILFWPYFVELVIVVAIPIINIFIILFNLFFIIAIVILSILVMIWNMLVPIIGMLITLIVNVLVTALAQVFQVIGAIDWEPIVSAFMDILMPMIDIAMQVVMVLIKVGPDIISAVANVIGELVEIIMMFVKVLVEIAAWLFQILYPILEPIVQIIGIFFGSFGQLFGARVLLSVEPGKTLHQEKDSVPINDYRSYVLQTLGPDYERSKAFDMDDYLNIKLNSIRRKEQTFSSDFGRKPLSKGRGGLEFVDDDELNSVNLDDVAHTMAHTMYNQAKKTPETIIDLAKITLDRINAHNNDKTALSLKALLTEYHTNNGHYDVDRDETLAAVRFSASPEHPQVMSERFHQQREHVKRVISGRKLLDINWDSKQEEYVSDMHIKHAMDIIEQERIYKEHHFDRMRNATVIYGAATKAMKESIEESGFDASTVVRMGGHVIERLGYKDIWHIYDDFMQKHGDPVTYMVSLSQISEQPIFKFFKEKHPVRPKETFFYDWAQMHLEMGSQEFSYAPNTGRFLMQAATGADKDIKSSGGSKESVGSLAIFSSLDCRGELQNPLCIPEVPIDFRIEIPTIKLDEETRRKLLKNVELCHPWEYSLALFDKWILWNAFQEVRFLLSAIPPINYTIAMLTVLMPWTGVFFDWMFMIPKFKTARIFQIVCFVRHLYSIFVIVILVSLIAIPISFFWPPTRDAWKALVSRYKTDKAKREARKDKKLKKLERIWEKFEARKEARMNVGAEMGGFVSGKIEHQHYIHLVDHKERRKLYNQDMQETYKLAEQHDDIWHNMLEHIHNNELELDYHIPENENTLRLKNLIIDSVSELDDIDE